MSGQQDSQAIDSRIIPVMREAVLMVQMILYSRLKLDLERRMPGQLPLARTRLAGAVVNNLFGTQPEDQDVARYGAEHRQEVERELHALADGCADLLPLLTDGLRMKVICDNQEGIHSIGSLLMAKALGLLKEDRELPLPSTFMLSVRKQAAAEGLVAPIQPVNPPEGPPA